MKLEIIQNSSFYFSTAFKWSPMNTNCFYKGLEMPIYEWYFWSLFAQSGTLSPLQLSHWNLSRSNNALRRASNSPEPLLPLSRRPPRLFLGSGHWPEGRRTSWSSSSGPNGGRQPWRQGNQHAEVMLTDKSPLDTLPHLRLSEDAQKEGGGWASPFQLGGSNFPLLQVYESNF